ncbi:MAG: aminodeoxychorismate synthase component I [Salinivenus sp.]
MFDAEVLTQTGTVLLDTARPDEENRMSWCFTAPQRVLTAHTVEEVPALIQELESVTRSGRYVAGYLSYEAGYAFVDVEPPPTGDRPLAWFGVYDAPRLLAPAAVEAGLRTLEPQPTVHDATFSRDQNAYTADIERVRCHIQAGDVYQINYTAPVRFRLDGDPRALYRRLRQRQHVPYGAYLNLGDTQVLSCSPELFFRRDGERVWTRPMKGTIRRGRTVAEDRALREELRTDPKNRAENLMIVDLLRNDLSVCCRPGSVQVPALYETETYDSVTQMTSTVEGRLQEGSGLADVIRALFPCGSITGAPKRRAMRIIRDLEPEPRGVYCGAIGMAGPDDTAVFNVAIRTAVLQGEEGQMGLGSGVVWDSEPETEYEECRLKGQFLTSPSQAGQATGEPLKLIETMRAEDESIFLFDRHLERLAESAAYFGYPFDETHVRQRVQAALSAGPGLGPLKVRVTLDRWGRVDLTVDPLQEPRPEPWRVTIAEERVDPTNPLFYHKTTHRGVYTRARAAARAAGFDEALLLNEEGQVTEGTYTNVFAEKGGELWTPPISCGLLGGVYRAHVLDRRPGAKERILALDDLRSADALYCCNALRGWRKVRLATSTIPA